MGVVARIKHLVRDHGIYSIATKLIGKTIDQSLERSLGIDTIGTVATEGLSIAGQNRARGNHYEGTRWMPLRQLIPVMQTMVDSDSALLDCGCGKGKVLLVAAECGVKHIRGVEFAKELCEVAEDNWKRFQNKRKTNCSFKVIHSDILDYSIQSNDSMFFLFNPFDAEVLNHLLDKILHSFNEYPRRIVIAVAFLSDHYREVFDKNPVFGDRKEVVFWACRFTLFYLGKSSP